MYYKLHRFFFLRVGGLRSSAPGLTQKKILEECELKVQPYEQMHFIDSNIYIVSSGGWGKLKL